MEFLGKNYNCSYRYNVSINDGTRVKGENGALQEGKTFRLSGDIGRGQERNGPFNSYIYGNKVYVSKDIIPKIAVDKASSGVFVDNNVFYFENDSVMVLGDQYKPDPGGGSEIENVFFENNIFKKNHWPKEVLIQPKNNILIPEYMVYKKKGNISLHSHLQANDLVGSKYIFDNLYWLIPDSKKGRINIDYIKGDSKGLWQGF